MATTPDPALRGYEELIGSLEGKLTGLSAVHEGLGEAAQSLVAAHRELGDAKQSIDLLTASSTGILEEVRRLQPAQLSATLDTGLGRVSTEMSESLAVLSERLLMVGREAAATRQHADERFAAIERRFAAQDTALADRFSATDRSFTSSLAAAQRTVAESLDVAQEATQSAITVVHQRQETLRGLLVAVHRQQEDLARRHDALLPLLAELRREQTDLGQRMESAAEAIDGIRVVADTTQSTTLATRHVADRLGPTVTSSLDTVRNDLVAEIARARRAQLASLVVVLVALGLAWAALEAFIPGV